MPTQPFITIRPQDLKTIIEALEAKRVGQLEVTIIDTGSAFIIRDKNDFKIDSVPKSNSYENNSG